MSWAMKAAATAAAILLAACQSSGPPLYTAEMRFDVETPAPDVVQAAQTFAFETDGPMMTAPGGQFGAIGGAEVEQAVREELSKRLRGQGLREVDRSVADVTVRVDAQGQEAWILRDVGRATVTEERFIDGAFSVVIADAATGATAWRSEAAGPVFAPVGPGARVRDTLAEVVARVMEPLSEARR